MNNKADNVLLQYSIQNIGYHLQNLGHDKMQIVLNREACL